MKNHVFKYRSKTRGNRELYNSIHLQGVNFVINIQNLMILTNQIRDSDKSQASFINLFVYSCLKNMKTKPRTKKRSYLLNVFCFFSEDPRKFKSCSTFVMTLLEKLNPPKSSAFVVGLAKGGWRRNKQERKSGWKRNNPTTSSSKPPTPSFTFLN